jgi:parvulin-like peptidyl-prolyl isomerase
MTTFLKTCIAVMIAWTTVVAADGPPASAVAATVNGVAITSSEVRGELARILRLRKKSEQELDQAALNTLKKEALDALIGRELLYQESQRQGIRVLDADVDAELSKLRGQFPREEDFNASLGKLELSREAVVRQIKSGMAIQALLESRSGSTAPVKESDVRGYYDAHQGDYTQPVRVRLSHILVKHGTLVSASGMTEARSKIEDIQRRISQGQDFALLARESDDDRSSSVGGDLGYFVPGQLAKNLEAAAFSLGVGQVSSIIEDRFGFHIIKVTERQPATVAPFTDVREKISRQLQRERTLNELAPYLKQLRKDARVEIGLTMQ